jgi:hypothetical protein
MMTAQSASWQYGAVHEEHTALASIVCRPVPYRLRRLGRSSSWFNAILQSMMKGVIMRYPRAVGGLEPGYVAEGASRAARLPAIEQTDEG